jgi:hypothetical protein
VDLQRYDVLDLQRDLDSTPTQPQSLFKCTQCPISFPDRDPENDYRFSGHDGCRNAMKILGKRTKAEEAGLV